MNIKEKLYEIKNAINELDAALTDYNTPNPNELEFSYRDYLREKIAVWCETEEDSKIFLSYLIGKGHGWRDGSPLTRLCREDYKDRTCYAFNVDIRFASKAGYEKEGYKVIKFNFDMLAEADDD